MDSNTKIDDKSVEMTIPNESDMINKSQKELDEIKDIMKDNINKVVIRGENLNDLNDSCDELETRANQFKTTCNKVERKMILKNTKYRVIILAIVLLSLLALVSLLFVYFLVIKSV